jgi:hypothetical protein
MTNSRPLPAQDFSVYGLRVRSSLPLAGWPLLPTQGDPDVTVIGESLDGPPVEGATYASRSVIEPGEVRLAIKGVARYRARSGTLIGVDPERDARPEDVQLYLTGALMGAILHQRGVFPLHASCVAIDGHGIGLAGPSGAGKSTLVTALVQRGATFVSDDISVLAPFPEGGFAVRHSAPRAKLDQSAIAALDRPGENLDSAGGNRGKFLVPVGSHDPSAGPVPLRRLYLLRDGSGAIRTERLDGVEAVSALVDETYFLRFASALGLAQQCFVQAAALARNLRVARLLRPRGFEHLPGLVDLIYAESRT